MSINRRLQIVELLTLPVSAQAIGSRLHDLYFSPHADRMQSVDPLFAPTPRLWRLVGC